MAEDKTAPTSLLMSLPLEVRHNIFEYATARDVKPQKLLRYWFEKKEVKELVAQAVASDPARPAPRVVYHDEHDEYEQDSDVPEEQDDEGSEEDSDNEDEDAEGDDGDNEDQDGEDAEEQDEEQDEDIEDEIEEAEDEDAMEEEHEPQPQDTVQPPASTQTANPAVDAGVAGADAEEAASEDAMDVEEAGQATNAGTATTGAPSVSATNHVQTDIDEDGDEPMDGQHGENGEDVDQDEDAVDGDDGADGEDGEDDAGNANGAAAVPQPLPALVIRASRKWRHIPNFMRITRCPPPVELLLASKQLNDEAKNWFYDVAMLRINATGSFAHTSFFEEAFSQITEAAFSPMENIRKVEALFVWDTTWLRADDTGCLEAIFPALLRQRSDFVYQILSQAPDLKEITIHWHDSAQDDESANLMVDILAPFHDLNPNVKIVEHYITADAKPHKRSIAGQQRVQFQQIADAGLDRLF